MASCENQKRIFPLSKHLQPQVSYVYLCSSQGESLNTPNNQLREVLSSLGLKFHLMVEYIVWYKLSSVKFHKYFLNFLGTRHQARLLQMPLTPSQLDLCHDP